MIVSVLGTAAGAGPTAPTSSYLIDGASLLDCGSGVDALSVEARLRIDRILLTHAHLDHCSALPALLSTHAEHGGNGLTVYALAETIDALETGLLADCPAYRTMASAGGEPLLRFVPIEVGDALPLPDGMATALPAQHSIPAVGWLIEGPWRALAYTGDSAPCPAFWHWSANVPSLSDIICEVTYGSCARQQAQAEGHMTPELLLPLLELVPPNVQVWISHLDDGQRQKVMTELRLNAPNLVNVSELETDTEIDL